LKHVPPKSEHCALHAALSEPKNDPQACAFALVARARVARRRVEKLRCMVMTGGGRVVFEGELG
jgi:hypothetical protein